MLQSLGIAALEPVRIPADRERVRWTAGGEGPRSPLPSIDVSESSAEAVPALSACVNILSGIMARAERYVVRRDDPSERIAHPVAALLNRPSPLFDPHTFWEIAFRDLFARGNCVMLILRGANGTPHRLVHTWAQDIQIEGGRLKYQLQVQDEDGIGNWRELRGVDARDVIHLGWYGRDKWLHWSDSPVTHFGRHAIAMQLAMARHNASTITRGGAIPFLLEVQEGSASPQQLKEMEDKLDSQHSGFDRAGRSMTLPPGVKAAKIAFSAVDLELIEMLKWGLREIARLYQVPLFVLQADEQKAGLQTSELPDRWKNFLRLGVEPHSARTESELNWKLMPLSMRGGRNPLEVRWDVSRMEIGSLQSLAELCTRLVGGGIWTPNEARRLTGRPPMDGGDALSSPAGTGPGGGDNDEGTPPAEEA